MKPHQRWIIICLCLALVGIYLFVTAPPPLPETTTPRGARLPVQLLFTLAQNENATMRKLWTEAIVGAGKAQGLVFSEGWKTAGVEAGPLPALFLRETAAHLEADPVPLSLFLGSDAPIRSENRFDAEQLKRFAELRKTRTPQFFYQPDTARQTAMFADVAVAPACVDCHNRHEKSPKKDWRLNDVMGATTWLYPRSTVSPVELLATLKTLRAGFRATYQAYLAKTRTFAKPPPIGATWPKEGFALPSVEHFMRRFEAESSPSTLAILLLGYKP